MLKETYTKFKKNILPKQKKLNPDFQEPVIEYCQPEQILDICSYNHYPVIEKENAGLAYCNIDNDLYDTSELEHEFEYGIYEDVVKTEQLMADLKCIDEAEVENKKLRDVKFHNFPLEQFSDAGKVANDGDPHLQKAADTELYKLEQCTIQMNNDYTADENPSKNTDENSSNDTDDSEDEGAVDYSSFKTVSHMHKSHVGDTHQNEHHDHKLHNKIYGQMYVPYKEDSQNILLPQTTDMSRKDNLKLLYNSHSKGTCDTEYESLEQGNFDSETFHYLHETSTKHVLIQGLT